MLHGNGGIIFGLMAGMLWGLDGVFLGNINSADKFLSTVMLIACIHDGLAALWILIVNVRNKKIKQYLKCFWSRQFIIVILCALLGGAAGMTANVSAIRLAGASYACAITSAYPVAGSIIGILFLEERYNIYSICGILSVALGAIVIGISPAKVSQSHFLIGIAAAVLAMICWALEGTLSKSAMEDISPDVLLGIRELISSITYIIVLVFMIKAGGGSAIFWKPGTEQIVMLFAASIVGAFSYLCWYRSMDISGVTVGMSLNATYALWAALFDVLLSGNRFSLQLFVGVAVILVGTVLTIHAEKMGVVSGTPSNQKSNF